jgi:hypothetical protein
MIHDPIVAEVRKARAKIAAECGYDLHTYFERQREAIKRWKGKVVDGDELLRARRLAERVPPKEEQAAPSARGTAKRHAGGRRIGRSRDSQ